MNNKEEDFLYKKLSIKCALCKTRFDIWISTSNFSSELEENIRKNFYRYCPVCKAIEALEKNKEK